MRLVRAKISGFRRFEDATVDLDGRLLAVVGPNEAGKSSLLEALALADAEAPIEDDMVTRGLQDSIKPNTVVLELRYLLDADDLKLLPRNAEGLPRYFVVGKRKNGTRRLSVDPPVSRARGVRRNTLDLLRRALNNTHIRKHLRTSLGELGVKDSSSSTSAVSDVLQGLQTSMESWIDDELLSNDDLEEVRVALSSVMALHENLSEGKRRAAVGRIVSALSKMLETEELENPEAAFCELLDNGRPRIFMMGQGHRNLRSSYPIKGIGSATGALGNLFSLAKLDPSRLQRAYTRNDDGERHAIEAEGNRELQKAFAEAWNQARVFPQFQLDRESVQILVPTVGTYSKIAERSDGLRTFVEICSFTATRTSTGKPILLIDEAEQHLHYDAQADLVNVFERQTVAAKIIYTTHSAGCLPNDLGRGIRVVEQVPGKEDGDSGRSLVSGSFWEKGPGFSPLMMGMGASVLALVPTRRAVIAEGASETILLPALLREAAEVESLGFQIAPGLAIVAKNEVRDLELEAPRVRYLVDGDAGGHALTKKLVSAGVDPREIFSLPKGLVLEDLVARDVYVQAANDVIGKYSEKNDLIASSAPTKGRLTWLKDECKKRKIVVPAKTRVAEQVVEKRQEGQSVVEASRRSSLKSLYRQLVNALE